MRRPSFQLELPLLPRGDETAWPFEPAFDALSTRGEPTPLPPLPPRPLMEQRAQALATALRLHLGMQVQLHVTDNRSTMLSFRRRDTLWTIRLHHMFLEAPAPIVTAIADYAGRADPSAGRLIDAFIRQRSEAIRPTGGPRPTKPLSPQGRFHDLGPLFDRINRTYFDNTIVASLGWGRAPGAAARRRSIRMGVYDHTTRTIRVHPTLDRSDVPEFFLGFILFHEMLHQAIPARQQGGRRLHHGPEFRARERAYPDYERAMAWEKAKLPTLLGRAQSRETAMPSPARPTRA